MDHRRGPSSETQFLRLISACIANGISTELAIFAQLIHTYTHPTSAASRCIYTWHAGDTAQDVLIIVTILQMKHQLHFAEHGPERRGSL